MICPNCGHIQSDGESCQQCGSLWIGERSASVSSPDRPTPDPVPNPRKPEKYRPRPLHDLDLTISLPGLSAEARRPNQADPNPLATVAQSATPMICTTTPSIEGHRIQKYLDVVSVAMFSPISVGEKTDPPALQKELKETQSRSLEGLRQESLRLGGNAVLGVSLQITNSPDGFWIFSSGTAVRIAIP